MIRLWIKPDKRNVTFKIVPSLFIARGSSIKMGRGNKRIPLCIFFFNLYLN